jgi:hypothetical protein
MHHRERALCEDEIIAARRVFGQRIDYTQVRVVNGRYGWLHHPRYVVCPNGRIYWPHECGNLASGDQGRHLRRFIHEMAHVLQHQHGVPVLRKGLLLHAARVLSLGRYDPYQYEYLEGKPFSRYNIEQQAQIAVGIFDGSHPDIIDY